MAYKESAQAAIAKYPDMEDDMLGMLSFCALDREVSILADHQ